MSNDMTKERADLGFADALDDFDPAEWVPKDRGANDKPAPPKAATKKAAAAAGFRSREPQAVEAAQTAGDSDMEDRGGTISSAASASLTDASASEGGEDGTVDVAGSRQGRDSESMLAMTTAPTTTAPLACVPIDASPATASAMHGPVVLPIATAPATDVPIAHADTMGVVPAPLAATSPASPDASDTRPDPYRRRRTGRSTQLSIKARPETIAAFYVVADRHGWVLGEALKRAVALPEREHGPDAAYRPPSSDPPRQNPGGAPCS